MNKILIFAAITFIAASAFGGGVIGNKEIPVMMVIDKTVVIDIISDPPYILLTLLDATVPVPGAVYSGFVDVSMTHNYPVIVDAMIVPFGPGLGPTALYKVALAGSGSTPASVMPVSVANWTPKTQVDELHFDTPATSGRIFSVGAAIFNADITYAPSGVTPQQVATVALTVFDNL